MFLLEHISLLIDMFVFEVRCKESPFRNKIIFLLIWLIYFQCYKRQCQSLNWT